MSSAALVSSAACAAASAGEAPRARAASVAAARSGVPPMLTSPTRPSWTAQPTMAQSMARWVNFWNDQDPAEADLGTRISVSSSSGSRAVSNRLWKNSPIGISREPPGPRATRVASSASSTAGRSEAGAAWRDRAADRPAVPDLRVTDLPGRVREQGYLAGQDVGVLDVMVPGQGADRDVG